MVFFPINSKASRPPVITDFPCEREKKMVHENVSKMEGQERLIHLGWFNHKLSAETRAILNAPPSVGSVIMVSHVKTNEVCWLTVFWTALLMVDSTPLCTSSEWTCSAISVPECSWASSASSHDELWRIRSATPAFSFTELNPWPKDNQKIEGYH